LKCTLGVLAFWLASASSLAAGALSFQGVFSQDDNIRFFNLSLAADSLVTIQGLAYGGGVNASGTTILSGGFDTVFSLFFADGPNYGVFDDDSGCIYSQSRNGSCLDSYFSGNIPAGSYVLAVTESDNFPRGGLSDGFTNDGRGNFTCAQGFCDLAGVVPWAETNS
jgi:hypothetical protein